MLFTCMHCSLKKKTLINKIKMSHITFLNSYTKKNVFKKTHSYFFLFKLIKIF